MTDFSDRERLFEEYLRDGISAVKSGQRKLAQSLLNRAIYLNSTDSRPYLWLSATTDNPEEQREYLERAVAIDPSDTAARRGLALLTGKIDKSQLMEQGAELEKDQIEEGIEVGSISFECPMCGGRMSFSPQEVHPSRRLICEYCGYSMPVTEEEIPARNSEYSIQTEYSEGVEDSRQDSSMLPSQIADNAEQTLDFIIPTTLGHRWAESRQLLRCERCGALNVLPPGLKATSCSYCGANQFVESPEQEELVEPQVIVLMKIVERQAIKAARQWLQKGIFSPDNLLVASRGFQLRPAYYSFWTFDGTVELHWYCEVAQGSGQYRQWVPMSGEEGRFFNDILVPGVKFLTDREITGLAPFNLLDVEAFKPEHLAGWTAIFYDRALSDASLLAREKVVEKFRNQVYDTIAIGREKRNVNIGSGDWSGLTYKHVLLPLWTGSYRYKGKTYHLLINGQTGKIIGDKPRDLVKLIFSTFIAIMLLTLIAILFWLLKSS
jgi:transcription elongation factor Elf1